MAELGLIEHHHSQRWQQAPFGGIGADLPAALHRLPKTDAEVETLFIRPKESFISSALGAFLERARVAEAIHVEAAE